MRQDALQPLLFGLVGSISAPDLAALLYRSYIGEGAEEAEHTIVRKELIRENYLEVAQSLMPDEREAVAVILNRMNNAADLHAHLNACDECEKWLNAHGWYSYLPCETFSTDPGEWF